MIYELDASLTGYLLIYFNDCQIISQTEPFHFNINCLLLNHMHVKTQDNF